MYSFKVPKKEVGIEEKCMIPDIQNLPLLVVAII